MTWTSAISSSKSLNLWQGATLAGLGVLAFHLAYNFSPCGFLMVVYLYALAALARQRTHRRAFYLGLGAGLFAYAPQLSCFYTIFGPAAIALWTVLAFWVALFGLLARLCLLHFGPRWAMALIPFVWTGLEYFRSEVYYLRFSWLNAGYAFSDHTQAVPFGLFGVYGLGFLLMLAASALNFLPLIVAGAEFKVQSSEFKVQGSKFESTAQVPTPHPSPLPSEGRGRTEAVDSRRPLLTGGLLTLTVLGIWSNFPSPPVTPSRSVGLTVAGVQLEFPNDPQLLHALDKVKKQHPEASLLVLSEYTFTEALPDMVKKWCRDNQRYLVVGGKDFVDEKRFLDTAFVIDPHGEIVFRQAKSVPIQFFNDGLPAREQKLWDSPWGKIGICICYDLSYTQVTDRLVRLGAQALIVPTMDVVDWGRRQHELHARIAPVRAAEYGLPIFRVASSGISQLVNPRGTVTALAPFAGEEATISGWLDLEKAGRVPLDRPLARAAVWVTGLLLAWLTLDALRKRIFR